MKGIESGRALYEAQGRDMLHRLFPEHEGRIAVGLAGRGSECFGFDDELSRDHDFEDGFCLWISDDDYKEIGAELSRAYGALPVGHATRRSVLGESNRGVQTIGGFFKPYTGTSAVPETWQQWLYLPSYALAEATNGEVWRDDLGRFTAIRNTLLTGMPEDVRLKKLAARAAEMAQSGQYNFSRCLKRGENGAAMLAAVEFVKAACGMVYLLNRRHMPYYKWMLRGMDTLPRLGTLREALEFLLLGENDEAGSRTKAGVIEDVSAAVIRELQTQNLSGGAWDYLEPHALEIMNRIQNPEISALHLMEA